MFGYFRNTHLGHVVCMEVVFITNELHIMHRVTLCGANSLHTRVALRGANSLHTKVIIVTIPDTYVHHMNHAIAQLAMLCD